MPMAPMGPTPDQLIAQQIAEQLERERREKVARTYGPMIRSLRDRRRPVEDEWMRNLDCWKAKHRRQGYRSDHYNYYLPVGRQKVENFVKKGKQQLWPAPDAIEVYPADDRRPDLGEQAEAIKNYLTWRLWRCRFRSQTEQILRSVCLYQRGIVKTFLDTQDVPGQVWPSSYVVDPFAFYVWPETATNIDRAQVLVEHTMMPFEEYAHWAQMGACDPIDPADLTKPEWPSNLIERLSRGGLSTPSDVSTGASQNREPEPIALVAMTELWVRKGVAWEQAWLVWNVTGAPKVVRREPQAVCPYRMAVDRQLPGEHYTSGLMSDLAPMNEMLNDQANMTLEGIATASMPIAMINTDSVTKTDSYVFGPRRKWLFNGPVNEAVKFADIPNTGAVGFQGMSMTMGLMGEFSGTSPLANGQPTRGMPRAGFAVSNLIALSMSDVRNAAELIEDEILTPLLGDLYRMTVGLPAQQLVAIPGAEAISAWRGTVQQLIGAVSFRWVGSLQAQDMQVRAQRMLTLIGQLPKLFDVMTAQGFTINFPLLSKRLWRDALGERGADTIIIPMQRLQEQLMAMGFVPPPLNAGVPAGGPASSQGGVGGTNAPAPASAEQAERQQSRGMTETAVGAMSNGLGMG
jgi:hypothetical protein